MSKTIERLIKEAVQAKHGAEKTASSTVSVSDIEKASEGLKKVASLPLNAETYYAVQEIMKIASEKIEEALSIIKSKDEVIDGLNKEAYVRGIVLDMADNGLVGEHDIITKTAELLGRSQRELEIYREAATMRASNGNENVFFSSEKTASEHMPGMPEKRRSSMFEGVVV